MQNSIDSQHEIKQRLTTEQITRKRRGKKTAVTVFIMLISIAIWGGLVYGGYYLANQYVAESKAYINQKVSEIKKQNQEQMIAFNELQQKLTEINDELLSVKGELVFIQEDLAITGETINGTDETKKALQERIVQLNTQLNELQASIKRLEDAAK